MSKHEKQVRRERKKTDRGRRRGSLLRHPTSHIPHAAAALAAAAVIAAGTQAYASPVRFDNPAGPGHFVWAVPLADNTNWLDITLDAAAQPGLTDGPTSLRHAFLNDLAWGHGMVERFNADIDVAVNYVYPTSLLDGLASGDLIGAGGLAWNSYGYATNVYYGQEAFPEGAPKYLGVRFDTGSGDQYAWIGVTRSGNELDAFAWGYETTPGVPIEAGVPEPNTLALLAFGAVAAIRKRRPA